MRFLDFFAGIGGFHSAFNRIGWECEGFCEIDKFARQSYTTIHNTEGIEEWHDITKVSDDDFRRFRGRVDIIAGGFPCQAFSVAGKRGGFEDTRGTLFFEVARAAKQIQPRYLLLENVKGLLNHDKGNTFGTILNTLHELGYAHIEWGVLNTKYWGVPQNRERVFILAELRDEPTKPYLLPLLQRQQENGVTARLRDVLETDVDEKYYLAEDKTKKIVGLLRKEDQQEVLAVKGDLISRKNPQGQYGFSKTDWFTLRCAETHGVAEIVPSTQVIANLNHWGMDIMNRVYGLDGQSPTLHTMQGGGREPKIAEPQEFTDGSGISYCIDASYAKGTSVGNIGKGRRTHAIEVHALTEKRSEEAKRIRSEYMKTHGVDFSPRRGKVIVPRPDHIANCLTATQTIEQTLLEKPLYRIRKLTPLETWRLQDFTDEQFYKAKAAGVSDSQLYKQAGNSVTVKVVEMIARQIQKRIEGESNESKNFSGRPVSEISRD